MNAYSSVNTNALLNNKRGKANIKIHFPEGVHVCFCTWGKGAKNRRNGEGTGVSFKIIGRAKDITENNERNKIRLKIV